MTENEKSIIHNSFKHAKDKQEQIIIEAELHCCDIEAIKSILAERGEDVEKYKYRWSVGFWEAVSENGRAKGFKGNIKKESEALELYNKGLDDKDIAKQLHVTSATIGSWRRENNLKSWSDKKKEERFEKVIELAKQGYKNSKIAEITGEKVKNIENMKAKYKKLGGKPIKK